MAVASCNRQVNGKQQLYLSTDYHVVKHAITTMTTFICRRYHRFVIGREWCGYRVTRGWVCNKKGVVGLQKLPWVCDKGRLGCRRYLGLVASRFDRNQKSVRSKTRVSSIEE